MQRLSRPMRVSALLFACLTAAVALAAERREQERERVLDTAVIEALALPAASFAGSQSVRLTYPRARGRFPLVVFSQGARSTPPMYARLAEHWAARGYIVVQPVPPPLSPIAIGTPANERLPATVQSRIAEIRFVLGAVGELEARVAALRGRVDAERIALAGHSVGALAALLAAAPHSTGEDTNARLEGIDAVVLIGHPGRTGVVPEDSWRALATPTLLATGSSDAGETSGAPSRAPAIALVPANATGVHFELYIRGMDTCLGGLICQAAPASIPDLAALLAIAETSTAFLNTHVRGDARGRTAIEDAQKRQLANGRGKLTRH